MRLTGYSLVSADGVEVETFSAMPNLVRLTNGDDVFNASSGETFSDGSRLLPVMRVDDPPGPWHDRLREERLVEADQVVVTVIYSEEPNLDAQRAQMIVSPFQAKAALFNAGLLDDVEALVLAPETPTLVKLAWVNTTEFRRTSTMVMQLATALNMTDEQLDELFIAASAIVA